MLSMKKEILYLEKLENKQKGDKDGIKYYEKFIDLKICSELCGLTEKAYLVLS